MLALIAPEWANFILAVIVAIVTTLTAVIGWFINHVNKKIENLEKLIHEIELDLQSELKDEDQKLLTEIKYNIKDTIANLKDEIKNLHHLINNIETRLVDRTNYAKAKWANLNQVINNILRYLEKQGYVSRDLPLSGVDATLTDKYPSDDDDLPSTNIF